MIDLCNAESARRGSSPAKSASRRRRGAGVSLLLAAALAPLLGCSGNAAATTTHPGPPTTLVVGLSASDVQTLVQNAATSASAPMVVAVVDRLGDILAIYHAPGFAPTATGNFGATVDTDDLAVSLARTAAFFSNDQAPISSRTVRFISSIHFPPGVALTANGPLYGIENSNRGCSLSANYLPGQQIPRPLSVAGTAPSLGIATGKADVYDSDAGAVNPGGVPIFKDGHEVGGVGVAGVPADMAEYAAYTAVVASGFGPNPAAPGVVVINGVSLPFVQQTTAPSGTITGIFNGTFTVGPMASPGAPPTGFLVAATAGTVGGLSATDVTDIIAAAVSEAAQTRAVLRLPPGSRTEMTIAVSDLDGTIIGLYRMLDSTLFSVDIAVSKARNMAYFNSASRAAGDLPGVPVGTAVTSRTIGYGAQPLFPPGIDGSSPGPFFPLYELDVAHPCTQGSQPANPNQSGVVFFPGSAGLYRNGVLVGGLGVSGDGVDQDDFVAAAGAVNYQAPVSIQASQITIGGVSLPYQSFPRDPTD